MSNADILKSYSSEELLKLAEKKRQEEFEAKTSHIREDLANKEAELKELKSRQRKELNALEKEIKALRKQLGQSSPSRRGARGSLTSNILSYLEQNGESSNIALRDMLDEKGVESKNLNQQLSYLKRCNRVYSPSRGMWALTTNG